MDVIGLVSGLAWWIWVLLIGGPIGLLLSLRVLSAKTSLSRVEWRLLGTGRIAELDYFREEQAPGTNVTDNGQHRAPLETTTVVFVSGRRVEIPGDQREAFTVGEFVTISINRQQQFRVQRPDPVATAAN